MMQRRRQKPDSSANEQNEQNEEKPEDERPRANPAASSSYVIRICLAAIVLSSVSLGTVYLTQRYSRQQASSAQLALRKVAAGLVPHDKGILAADESPRTFGKRLVGRPNNEATRREYRDVLLSAPGLEEYISGVILHEESFGAESNATLELLRQRGVALGIKLDQGLVPLSKASPLESATKGLEGLAERCGRFRARGASFAKWRAVFRVSKHTPSGAALRRNAADLAAYAAEAQRCGLVPVLEPELLPEGDHGLQRAEAATTRVLCALFRALRKQRDVDLRGLLLKVALVTPGRDAPPAQPRQVASSTLRVLVKAVPPQVAGIVFLSGGLSEEDATAHLLALGRAVRARTQAKGKRSPPWPLSFSFGRALQHSAMARWSAGSVEAAREAVVDRARANAMAQQGRAPK